MAEQLPENEVMTVYQHLKCSVCKEFYTPPIFICQSGHNFCNNCQSNRPRCHDCYRDRTRIQNLTLERLISAIRLPCSNAQFGCNETMSLSNRENHVRNCNFIPFICPIDNCFARMGINTIIHHLQEAHNITEEDGEEDRERGTLVWERTLNGCEDNCRAFVITSRSFGRFMLRELRPFRDNRLYICQTLSGIDHERFRYILQLSERDPGERNFTFRGTPQPLNSTHTELMECGNYLIVNGRLNQVHLVIRIEQTDVINNPPNDD